MSAGVVVHVRDRGSTVVTRRLPARYPLALIIIAASIVVAACAGGRPLRVPATLDGVPFQPRPEELTSVKLPVSTEEIVATAAKLPETLIGQASLPSSGWQSNDHFVTAWGVPNGQAGTPPITLAIRHVASFGVTSAASADEAIIREANRPLNITGPVEVGRDGQMIWFTRSDAGHTVVWGRHDNPWLYVVTASSQPEVDAVLEAFATAAGRHSAGNTSTLR